MGFDMPNEMPADKEEHEAWERRQLEISEILGSEIAGPVPVKHGQVESSPEVLGKESGKMKLPPTEYFYNRAMKRSAELKAGRLDRG